MDTAVAVRLDNVGHIGARVSNNHWRLHHVRGLVALDTALLIGMSTLAAHLRFGSMVHVDPRLPSYGVISVLLVVAWVLVLFSSGAYQARYVGCGSEEFRRVGYACVHMAAVVATISYAMHLDLSRGYVVAALGLGSAALLIGRYMARKALHWARRRGYCLHRVLAVGDDLSARMLATEFQRAPYAGYSFVGSCPPLVAADDEAQWGLRSTVDDVWAQVVATRADTVAVTTESASAAEVMRRLAWRLEGTDVDLVVAPALTDIAGPRISIRPVAGLPLLHVDEPKLDGISRVVKATYDRAAAMLLLVLAGPVLVAIAVLVKCDSRGSAMFCQRRVGLRGKEFTVWKFRSMHVDAEARLASLAEHNDGNGLLFKMRDDPRVTRVGRWLRRYSLDELPQLLNVLVGDMSLVGPRPPLPREVADYDHDLHRRLVVKPGLTGLWQVSGRSDLPWKDAVRLDLYYIENWSLVLDAMILWKTAFAVARGRGAY